MTSPNRGCPVCTSAVFPVQNWFTNNKIGKYSRCPECRKFFDTTDARRRLCGNPECKKAHNKKTAARRHEKRKERKIIVLTDVVEPESGIFP